MKTTLRLVFALAVSLVTTASASAWCHRMAAAPYPMMGYGMPMMPAMSAGGMSFNMSMSASGDPTMAFMGPLMLRQLISGFLNSPGVNMTETQLITALPRILPLLGVPTMTAEQIATLAKDLQDARLSMKGMQDTMKGMQDTMKGLQDSVDALRKTMENPSKKKEGDQKPTEAETARTQAEVKRLLAEIKAMPDGPGSRVRAVASARTSAPNPEAEVKRLLAEIKAMPASPAGRVSSAVPARATTTDPETEVKRLLAEIKAMPSAPKPLRGAAVVSRGK